MKTLVRYSKILLGCLLIAFALNIFFIEMELVPSGIFGFAILYNYKTEMDLGLIIFLINMFFLLLSDITIPKEEMKKMVVPFIMVPLLTHSVSLLPIGLNLQEVDKLLISLYGGILMGLGYRFIYKEDCYASGADVITEIAKRIHKGHKYAANYIFDGIWIIIAIFLFGFEVAMYSTISIVIMEVLSRRASIGISDSKVFYIITKKEKEVRDYIIEELGYDITIFDVKGGFLKTKNKVLMSVIPTKDYYRLREGIKQIDASAFISITDSYEVINPNKQIKMRS